MVVLSLFRNLSIGKKLLIMCLLLVALPVFLLAYISAESSSKALQDSNLSLLDRGVEEIRETLDINFLRGKEDIRKFASSGNLQTYLSLQNGNNKGANNFMNQNAATVLEGLITYPRIQEKQKQEKLESDIRLALSQLDSLGGVSLSSSEIQPWKAENQYTHVANEYTLPLFYIDKVPLRPIRDFSKRTPLVDKITEITGSTCTIFQRLNPEGDMLRVASTVRKLDGTRAVGTYIPAVNPNGKPNPVVERLMAGETYRGRAFVVNDWYITIYKPMKDDTGNVIGALYLGVREKDLAAMQEIIASTRIGTQGYPFVVDREGMIVLHPDQTLRGKKLGKDLHLSDLETICRSMQKGKTDFTNYSFNGTLKGAALQYFPYWEWTFVVSYYPQDMASAMMDMTRNKLILDIEGLGKSAIQTGSGMETLYSQIRFMDKTGMEIFKYENGKICSPEEMKNKADEAWFQQGLDLSAGEVLNTDVVISENTGLPEMRIISPVFIEEEIEGLAVFNLNWRALTTLIRGRNYGKSGYAFILNENGEAICHPEFTLNDHFSAINPDLGDFAKIVKSRILAGESGNAFSSYQGTEQALSYTPMSLGDHSFYAVTIVPTSEIFSSVSRLTRMIFIVGIILVLGGAISGFLYSRSLTKPIRKIMSITERGGSGDFSMTDEELSFDRGDELGQMAGALARMIISQRESMTAIIAETNKTVESAESLFALSEETNASVEEVKSAVEQVVKMSEENSAALEQTNAGVQDVSTSANNSAQASNQGATATTKTIDVATVAVDHVNNVIEDIEILGDKGKVLEKTVNEFGQSVKSISGFVETITGIADQTNLLALNAAIEAARAGDAGRGFAVVADEVRKLAEGSAKAANEIRTLINSLQKEALETISATSETGIIISKTVVKAKEAQELLSGGLSEINKITDLMHDIAAGAQEEAAVAEEMAAGVDQVTSATNQIVETIGNIRNNSEETAKASESVARHAQELAEGARRMQEQLARFKIERPEESDIPNV